MEDVQNIEKDRDTFGDVMRAVYSVIVILILLGTFVGTLL